MNLRFAGHITYQGVNAELSSDFSLHAISVMNRKSNPSFEFDVTK